MWELGSQQEEALSASLPRLTLHDRVPPGQCLLFSQPGSPMWDSLGVAGSSRSPAEMICSPPFTQERIDRSVSDDLINTRMSAQPCREAICKSDKRSLAPTEYVWFAM